MKMYPAKLLLVGEYAVLYGGSAIAFPYPEFSGQWARATQVDQSSLIGLYQYLVNHQVSGFAVDQFARFLQTGGYFESSIPVGYGLGSSGALSAAMYDAFFKKGQETISEVHQILMLVENYFHEKSSGIDPLISYINRPVVITANNEIQVLEQDIDLTGIEMQLVDSGQARNTQQLVALFKQKIESDATFKDAIINHYVPLVNACVQQIIQPDIDAVMTLLRSISHFQFEHLNWLIPEHIQDPWKIGLDGNGPIYKLCGAGGGGMFLSFGWTH